MFGEIAVRNNIRMQTCPSLHAQIVKMFFSSVYLSLWNVAKQFNNLDVML